MSSLYKLYKTKSLRSKRKKYDEYCEFRPCANCGKELRITASYQKYYKNFYCDKKCEANARSFGRNKELKGGWQDKNGYWYIRVNGKPTLRHRAIMVNKIGRKLRETEQVHHINGKAGDDRIENLMIVDYKNHPSEKDRKIRILQKKVRELENVLTKIQKK